MSSTSGRSRWVALFALLIIVATGLFVVGAAVERNQGHTEATTSSTETSEHSEGEAGEVNHPDVEAGNTPTKEAGNEKFLGLDTESIPVVTVAVLIALLLVAAIWWRPRRDVLIAAILFCLGAAALDVREVLHQLDESRGAVAALATAVALLHLAAAGAGGAALHTESVGPSKSRAAA